MMCHKPLACSLGYLLKKKFARLSNKNFHDFEILFLFKRLESLLFVTTVGGSC